MSARHFLRTVCAGYVITAGLGAVLLTLQGCAQGEPIAAGTLDLQPPEPEIAVPVCTLTLAPAPDIREATEQATERLAAATGCTFSFSEGGVPVVFGEMRATDEGTACGQNANTYDTDTGVVLTEDSVTVADNYRNLVTWPADSILVHELMHALINQPGQVFDNSHAPSGVFAAHTEPGDDALTETSLSYFCERAACVSFAPEL